jgi:hypothetical protein
VSVQLNISLLVVAAVVEMGMIMPAVVEAVVVWFFQAHLQ